MSVSEVFVCVWLTAQHRVLAFEELFRGTLTQTSVYPREEDRLPPPPVPVKRPKPVMYGFSCGDGPCRAIYTFENEAQQAPVKALPDQPEKAGVR